MLRFTLMTVLCLFLFPILPLQAVACSNMVTANAEGEANAERVSNQPIHTNAGSMQSMMTCTEPRPQICTQDYRPVCAMLQDGSLKTYSNGCNACSDPAVTGYREGACE
jgi:hypothetical protein